MEEEKSDDLTRNKINGRKKLNRKFKLIFSLSSLVGSHPVLHNKTKKIHSETWNRISAIQHLDRIESIRNVCAAEILLCSEEFDPESEMIFFF